MKVDSCCPSSLPFVLSSLLPSLLFLCLLKITIYFWLCWVSVAAQAFLQLQQAFLAAVRRLLIAVASLVAAHGPQGPWAAGAVECGLRSCGSRVLEHRLSSGGAQASL